MVVTTERVEDLNLIGGRPCLDFVNTEGGQRNGPPERLDGYAALLAWSVYAGVADAARANRLEEAAREKPAEAENVAARAVALREALYRILSAVTTGRAPASADLEVLNGELREAFSQRVLEASGAGLAWRFEADGAPLGWPLWVVVEDAGELLTSGDLSRVKECAGESCSWLFLDESRNRSRRWCDMGDCGNRAKVRRYRERHGG